MGKSPAALFEPFDRPRQQTPLVAVPILRETETSMIFLKLENRNWCGSIKYRTARALLASVRRHLSDNTIVIESTSGNLGLAMATLCGDRGLQFVAVVDPRVPRATLEQMTALGASVEMVQEEDPKGGFLASRVARARALSESDPHYVWTNQYENWANPAVHACETGPEIARQTEGRCDAIFIAVSTGGTLAGIGSYMRHAFPSSKLIAVDCLGSLALGAVPGPRHLVGIGAGRPSAFVTRGSYDECVRVADAQALAVCRKLRKETGLSVGGSSGAVLAACLSFLPTEESRLSAPVCVCADGGDAYEDSIYADAWLDDVGLLSKVRELEADSSVVFGRPTEVPGPK